jgi:hypothetical protein
MMVLEEEIREREWGQREKKYEMWGLLGSKALMCIKV